MTFPPLLLQWKNDIFYDNTKPDIVISVIFTQNEDLVVTYWNIELNQEGACPDQNISAENCFHLPPVFQDVIKQRQRRVYFRVVMQQQCKTELHVHSALLVMHFLIFFSKLH